VRSRFVGRHAGVILAVLAASVAIGCGGGDDGGDGGGGPANSDEAAIRDTFESWAKAVSTDDGKTACSLMTERAQEEASDTVPGAGSCERAHEIVLRGIKDEDKEKLAERAGDANLKISVDGDRARVTGKPGDKGTSMRKVGGKWLIDQNTVTFNPD
jgi:hypothetical protein